ncbi:mitochondrial folate transporter/carrier-like isoform X2 [Paramacrobiotus metropolitanus]|uniref:mitochondrial folate transporter/carrier-like isoform X2 n=1 Tax=Paramacrobiotus metropolitanus TaxID=2943436 RepID=UPI0024461CE5|nr:mitochondrial folate transporter/carrier-like isoform X2 [Paramacrobiotus metropolitanus]
MARMSSSFSGDADSPPIAPSSALTRLNSILHRPEQLEHLVAGISGGVVSTLVLHPLDLIKVRFAVNDGTSPHSAVVSRGLRYAFAHTWREGGIRALYQGVTPSCLGAGTSWGVYFLMYNLTKEWMAGINNSTENLTPVQHMLAAANAGVWTLFVTNPIWVVKTRICLQYNQSELDLPQSKRYKGLVDCFAKIYKYEGIRGLYKGLIPGMFGVSHGALQFMAYEELKKRANKFKGAGPEAKLGTVEYLTYAAISKLFAATATYPYQVIRARLQDQHKNYNGLWDVIVRTWRKERILGFYKGLVPYLLAVTPNVCLVFLTYEKLAPRAKEKPTLKTDKSLES